MNNMIQNFMKSIISHVFTKFRRIRTSYEVREGHLLEYNRTLLINYFLSYNGGQDTPIHATNHFNSSISFLFLLTLHNVFV